MKFRYLCSAYATAAALVASPLAYSGGQGTQVIQFRGYHEYAYSCYRDDPNFWTCFGANVSDDTNGVPQGDISLEYYQTAPVFVYRYISCYGPNYASVVSVNPNGESRIRATLDPTAADCYATNVDAPVTVNLVGSFNGNYRESRTGTGKETHNGLSYQYRNLYDAWGATFTGTNGFYAGTFNDYYGVALRERKTNRQQLK